MCKWLCQWSSKIKRTYKYNIFICIANYTKLNSSAEDDDCELVKLQPIRSLPSPLAYESSSELQHIFVHCMVKFGFDHHHQKPYISHHLLPQVRAPYIRASCPWTGCQSRLVTTTNQITVRSCKVKNTQREPKQEKRVRMRLHAYI